MKKTRQRYDREFKISVVAELESGKPLAQIAREHGVHPSLPCRWRSELAENPERAFRGNGRKHLEDTSASRENKVEGLHYPKRDSKKGGITETGEIFKATQNSLSKDPTLSICRACQLHGMSRSNYYKWKNHPRQAKQETEFDIHLRNQIQETIKGCPDYGYRRVSKELKKRGYAVNHKKVLRIIRENSLR